MPVFFCRNIFFYSGIPFSIVNNKTSVLWKYFSYVGNSLDTNRSLLFLSLSIDSCQFVIYEKFLGIDFSNVCQKVELPHFTKFFEISLILFLLLFGKDDPKFFHRLFRFVDSYQMFSAEIFCVNRIINRYFPFWPFNILEFL